MNIINNSLKDRFLKRRQRHLFHLVDPSPWPFLISFAAFTLTVGLTLFMHRYEGGAFLFFYGLITVIYIITLWWRDVIREGTFLGHHTSIVQKGLKMGMALFIISEIMFFFAFFWGFFHSVLSPTIWIGGIWPPAGITPVRTWTLPFWNTLILVWSGIALTWSHKAMESGFRTESFKGFFLTIGAAVVFTGVQLFEYNHALFDISDGIYGSCFYMLTGFHGFHVLCGTIFIIVCLYRQYKFHFTSTHHVGFISAAWYWHFVDVVWIFLFLFVYWWGNS